MSLRSVLIVPLAVGFFIMGLSGAQFEGSGYISYPIYSSEFIDVILDSSGGQIVENQLPIEVGDGQTMTGVDTSIIVASGLTSLWPDIFLIAGGNDLIISSSMATGEDTSGIIAPVISDPISHLIISEVYYDGTDEWIEITNIGSGNFQGNFTLVGVKSTNVFLTGISIVSGESKIFGDSLAQISGTSFIEKTGLAFNITDTTAIAIQILISGQLEDSFWVDQPQVTTYNDKKTSFEKDNGIIVPVQTAKIANAQSGYIINPGIYWRTGNDNDIVSIPSGEFGVNLVPPSSCDFVNQRDLIKINEIFLGNEKYPPYIELIMAADIGLITLSISGDLLATSVEFSWGSGGTTLENKSLLLLSATDFRKGEEIQSVRNNDFSLLSTGKNLVITIGSGQNGQVMDIVTISGNMLGKSSYFTGTGYPCARILDAMDDFSPGFERRFLKYFPLTTVTKIEYVLTGIQTPQETGSCQVPLINPVVTTDISVDTSGMSLPGEYIIHILDIEYDPEGSDTNNEKITLLATNSSGNQEPLDLSKVFRLRVNGNNKTLPWILPMNVPTTFTKTFGFPNSTDDGQAVIITLTYGEYVFASYTYNPNTTKLLVLQEEKKENITGDLFSTGITLDISGLQFIIQYVLPNPKGSDAFEELGLFIQSNEQEETTDKNLAQNTLLEISGVDLSQGFSLKIGNKNKKLKGIVHIGQENILSGSLGLVNKAACVSLLYQEQELTKLCYRIPKEDEKIYTSDTGLQEISQANIDILNTLQLKKIDNQLCIWYKQASVLCKRIPASKAEIKVIQEQKLYKGFSSLIKQYIINNRQNLYYNTPIKLYFDLVAQNKKLIGQGHSQVDIYGQSLAITDLKEQIAVLETTSPGIIALFEGIYGTLKK